MTRRLGFQMRASLVCLLACFLTSTVFPGCTFAQSTRRGQKKPRGSASRATTARTWQRYFVGSGISLELPAAPQTVTDEFKNGHSELIDAISRIEMIDGGGYALFVMWIATSEYDVRAGLEGAVENMAADRRAQGVDDHHDVKYTLIDEETGSADAIFRNGGDRMKARILAKILPNQTIVVTLVHRPVKDFPQVCARIEHSIRYEADTAVPETATLTEADLADASDWVAWQPKGEAFEMQVPVLPTKSEQRAPLEDGTMISIRAYAPPLDAGMRYVVEVFDHNVPESAHRQFIDGFSGGFGRALNQELQTQLKSTEKKPYGIVRLYEMVSADGLIMTLESISTSKRLYLLIAFGSNEDPSVKRLLGSFKLKP